MSVHMYAPTYAAEECIGDQRHRTCAALVEGEQVMLGRWQGIYLCEFDGPRERQVWIKLVRFEE